MTAGGSGTTVSPEGRFTELSVRHNPYRPRVYFRTLVIWWNQMLNERLFSQVFHWVEFMALFPARPCIGFQTLVTLWNEMVVKEAFTTLFFHSYVYGNFRINPAWVLQHCNLVKQDVSWKRFHKGLFHRLYRAICIGQAWVFKDL